MKLIVAIITNDDANKVQRALNQNKFQTTRLVTTGGFLRSKNATFLIGVNDELVPQVLDIIDDNSKKRRKDVPSTILNEFGGFSSIPVSVEVGGAVVFVLDAEQFLRF